MAQKIRVNIEVETDGAIQPAMMAELYEDNIELTTWVMDELALVNIMDDVIQFIIDDTEERMTKCH